MKRLTCSLQPQLPTLACGKGALGAERAARRAGRTGGRGLAGSDEAGLSSGPRRLPVPAGAERSERGIPAGAGGAAAEGVGRATGKEGAGKLGGKDGPVERCLS